MAHVSEPDLLVLHAVRIKGFAEAADVSEATDIDEDDAAGRLAAFHDREILGRRDGRITGYFLAAGGRELHGDLLDRERTLSRCETAVAAAYEAFLGHNETFKQLCTDWQLRPVNGSSGPNDHSDASYDAGIVGRLAALQPKVRAVLDELVTALVRFGPYDRRLQSAVDRFAGGEATALARPLTHSYHDVWMELHEDLLLTLGRDRSEADG